VRITQRAIAQTSLQGLNGNLAAIGRLQEQLTSGKVLNKPSDSPTGTNRAMQTRRDIDSVMQQARNISDGKGFLDGADKALQTMLAQTRRVRDLTVQAANVGATSETSRQAIATEVASIRQSLLGVANLAIQGQPIFGGATAGTKAYDEVTGAYVGVGGAGGIGVIPLTRRVSDSEAIRIEITGPEAFGDPATGDLFAVVKGIADDVVAGDPAVLAEHLKALDGAITSMLTAAADLGIRSARLESAEEINLDRQLTLQAALTEVEDVDLPRTIMELQMQQTGYEAALSATAKAIQPTLVDFLR
jgi:flagellar hook-associated protein 3 FlgL